MPRSHHKQVVKRSKPAHSRTDPQLADDLAAAQNLRQLGRASEAETAYKRILKIDKHCVPALAALGTMSQQQGDYTKALKFLERAIKCDTSNHFLRLEFAKTHLARGDIVRAEAVSERALELENSFEVHCLRAEIFERNNDIDRALSAYKDALEIRKDVPGIHNNLGVLYRLQGKHGEALGCFDRSLQLNPNSLAARNNRGNTLKDLGDYGAAIVEYLRALDLSPKHIDTLYNLALCYQQIGDMASAMTRLKEIVEIAPEHELSHIQIVETQINLGHFEEAEKALDELLGEFPGSAQAWFLKTSLRKYRRFEPTLFTPITDLLNADPGDRERSVLLNFALGKLFDDIDDHDQAFLHYDAANKLQHKQLGDVNPKKRTFTESLLESRAEDWRVRNENDDLDTPNLIFIVGMPRSGTTLIEQILSVHSTVTAAGEVDFFESALRRLTLDRAHPTDIDIRALEDEDCQIIKAGYLSRLNTIAPGASTVTDKTPANYYYLGLIQRLFPHARIIRAMRHPLDTCLSIYFQLFNSIEYAYDLSDIGDKYIKYDALMAHWRSILNLNTSTICYEQLVESPEDSIRELLACCDLPWEQKCLTPNEVNRSINTMSRWQARQPLYRHSVRRWQNYEQYLGSLRHRLAPILQRYPDPAA